MLSRLADCLYWIGRYLERADGTARMLDVRFHRALGSGADAEVSTTGLIHDVADSGSIASSLHAAWTNARGARDLVPSELFECLNATVLDLRWSTRGFATPHAALTWVKQRCAMAFGIIDGSMRRDDPWQFLTLGRGIERVDMTVRVLAAGSTDRVRLLVDSAVPRSVIFSLREVDACLASIDRDRSDLVEPGSARWHVGRAVARLSFLDESELSGPIDTVLDELANVVVAAHAATEHRYFDVRTPISWSA